MRCQTILPFLGFALLTASSTVHAATLADGAAPHAPVRGASMDSDSCKWPG